MTERDMVSAAQDQRPLLVCLHWLGGSGRTWDLVAARLEPEIRLLGIDLPGFGDAAHLSGASVAAMADHVAQVVRSAGAGRWMLAGHSMGAKVALAVARQAEDGAPGLGGLSHLVLLAGSPPAPEPMDEARRQEMLGWFAGSPETSRAEAQQLIDGSVGAPLDPAGKARVSEDMLRLNREAWVAWLERGSREDWIDRIGVLATPALVIAGEKDGDLGPAGQKRLMTRHLARLDFVVLPGVGHLAPVERPDEVARLIAAHVREGTRSTIPRSYRSFIESDRVSARARELLLDRGEPDDPERRPKALSPAQMNVLRALVDRILPQPEPRIDIAARMDEGLGSEPGDGWRFADLPSDQESYRWGIDTLQDQAAVAFGRPFAALDPAEIDKLLAALPKGQASTAPPPGPGRLGPHGMALWFEDLRANTVRVYMSHPLAMARCGYSGIGYGGDGERLQGFEQVGLGEVEAWEPQPLEASQSSLGASRSLPEASQ